MGCCQDHPKPDDLRFLDPIHLVHRNVVSETFEGAAGKTFQTANPENRDMHPDQPPILVRIPHTIHLPEF